MRYPFFLRLGLLTGSLSGLAACSPAPNQLTVVRGTVTSATTGRPLAGVLLGIESYKHGYFGPVSETFTGDSVRTDALGHYELHFYNQKGLAYAVGLEPYFLFGPGWQTRTPRYVLDAGGGDQGTRAVTIGQPNVVDFQPEALRTLALRIRNRNTRYQRLLFGNDWLPGNNLDTLAYLRYFYPAAGGTSFTYRRLTATGAVIKDTLVKMVVQNPASLPPDTLRATLTFVR